MEAVKLLPWCISVVVPLCYISKAATMDAQQRMTASSPYLASAPPAPEPEPQFQSIQGSNSSTGDVSSTSFFLARHHPGRYSFVRMSFCWPIHSSEEEVGPPSDSPNHLHTKRTCITSPEVEVGSEHNSHMVKTICPI